MTAIASHFTAANTIKTSENARSKAHADRKIEFMLNLAAVSTCIASVYYFLSNLAI